MPYIVLLFAWCIDAILYICSIGLFVLFYCLLDICLFDCCVFCLSSDWFVWFVFCALGFSRLFVCLINCLFVLWLVCVLLIGCLTACSWFLRLLLLFCLIDFVVCGSRLRPRLSRRGKRRPALGWALTVPRLAWWSSSTSRWARREGSKTYPFLLRVDVLCAQPL